MKAGEDEDEVEHVAKIAKESVPYTLSRPGTSITGLTPHDLGVEKLSTRGNIVPNTSRLARSMSLNSIHLPCFIARTKTPSFHSNCPGCVIDETYVPNSDLASRDVSAKCNVIRGLIVLG
jgi:hypothetical protein